MFAKSYGEGTGVGVNKGKIRSNIPVSFGSGKTEDGGIHLFLGEGRLTDDAIEEAFFGSGVVMEHARMQEILQHIGREGYRHHLSLTEGNVAAAAQEALVNYLQYQVKMF